MLFFTCTVASLPADARWDDALVPLPCGAGTNLCSLNELAHCWIYSTSFTVTRDRSMMRHNVRSRNTLGPALRQLQGFQSKGMRALALLSPVDREKLWF